MDSIGRRSAPYLPAMPGVVFRTVAMTFLAVCVATAGAAPGIPNSTVASNFFFTVHSNTSSAVWVAPPTWKVMRDTVPPGARGAAITLHAARNEYEPVQIVFRAAAAGTRTLSLDAWEGPSRVSPVATLHDVSYGADTCATGNPDRLEPIDFGAAQTLCAGGNQVFWLTVFVPANAMAGVYSNALTCTVPGTNITIPLRVHVFDFALPGETSFGSLVDWSFSGALGDTTETKRWFHQHRLTPRTVTWPSAMQHNITWNSSANPSSCVAFYDEGDLPAQISIRSLAHKFVAGVDFNDGVGFPNFLAQSFVDNTQQRPALFCGQSIAGDPRGAQYGTAAYNAAWSSFLSALQNYCDPGVPPASGGNPFGHNYLSKAIYFVMSEPQNASDYNLAAWLAQLSRQAAPKLRLMISEEAKPEIYDNPLYPGQGYDIWLAHLPAYSSAMGNSLVRKRDHGEQTWWYSLAQDPAQFISPNQANRSALDTRMLTWLAWHHRVEGWSTSGLDVPMMTASNGTIFVPTIRSELLREAMEDYEYFRLASGGQKAAPFQTNHADRFVSLIAGSLTGFDRDPSKLHWLRVQMGRQISGEGASSPLLPVAMPRPYGSYYIDFNTNGSPFTYGGRTWIPMGWQVFDPVTATAGWFVANTNTLRYASAASGNVVERTYIYDDFERLVTFAFALANGVYDVEVGAGRPGGFSDMLVTVNGIDFFGNRLANAPQRLTNTYATVTNRITVANEMLLLEAGRQVGLGYNFLGYLAITAVGPSSPDGVDDAWQTLHFGSATNVLAGPNADPDGDGASNSLEFHSGTNPNSAASRPHTSATFPAADRIEIAFTSATNHLFRVDRSGDLLQWNIALNGVTATSGVTRVLLPREPGAPQEFFRVAPLAP
jgi:hypothetical protein